MVNEQLQLSLDDYQRQLSIKRSELESAEAQIKILEEQIGRCFENFVFANAHLLWLPNIYFRL